MDEKLIKSLAADIGRAARYSFKDASVMLDSARSTTEEAMDTCIYHMSSLEEGLAGLTEALSSVMEAYILLYLLDPEDYGFERPLDERGCQELARLRKILKGGGTVS